jgi:branched-subunit amino acid ABC-type transport system permease component
MRSIIENGLVIGSVYAAVAFGIVLIYRATGVLSFAQAESGSLGTFLFYTLWVERGLPYLLAASAGVLISGALGFGVRTVLRPIEHRPLQMVLGTLGLASVMVYLTQEIWGSSQYFMPPPFPDVRLDLGVVEFAGPRLLVVIVTAALALGFFLVFRFTPFGVIFRAAAQDPYASTLLGLNVGFVRTACWVAAGALSGLAGILVAPLVNFQVFFMSLLIVRALAASLLARLTNLTSCLAYAILIGILEATISRRTSSPGVPELLVVCLLVVILVVRGDSSSSQRASLLEA